MVRGLGSTNRADKYNKISFKNNNVKLYRNIFRTPTYLMSEEYSTSCQITKMMRHIENSGIVTTVYSAIFRHIQGHSDVFSYVQAY